MSARAALLCLAAALSSACTRPSESVTGAAELIRVTGSSCDASALVGLPGGWLVGASDENNGAFSIAPTDRTGGTFPSRVAVDLSPFLQTERNKRGEPKEADLEAAARLGETVYWIGSHGRDSGGDAEPSRQRLFATRWQVVQGKLELQPAGQPVTRLLEPMLRGDSDVALALRQASTRAHVDGGIDIEGLAATARGTLLIGFRSPLVGGRAIMVELLNPSEATLHGAEVRLGPPALVNLGGRGIRDMVAASAADETLLLAGPPAKDGTWALFRWRAGDAAARAVDVAVPAGVVWEGLTLDPDTGDLWLASDDGGTGPKCKDREPQERSFRLWRAAR
jgi:hypothetical protein